jgi:hypothetical protein
MQFRGGRSISVAVLIAAVVPGCDGPPDRPSHLDSFRMTGPTEIAPGSSASFTAILDRVATMSDVSGTAEWVSSNPSVLSVAAGVATGRASGEATVTAQFEGQQTDPAPVMVLPAGTYRLRGTVTLPTSATQVVPLARVEVPSVGLVTTADAQGRFVLYGVPADAEIRASKEGYTTAVASVHLVDHLAQVRVSISPALEGTYTLSIGPGSCSDVPPVPANLLRRTYTVAFLQSGPNPSVANGSFPGATNITVMQFSASFVAAQGTWTVSLAIGEPLPDGKNITLNGFASVTASDLVGTFTGRYAIYEPSTGETLNRCTANRFPFVLTR